MSMAVHLPDLSRFSNKINRLNPTRTSGRVTQVLGLTIQAIGLDCQIGEVCEIHASGESPILSEVVGFSGRPGAVDAAGARCRAFNPDQPSTLGPKLSGYRLACPCSDAFWTASANHWTAARALKASSWHPPIMHHPRRFPAHPSANRW